MVQNDYTASKPELPASKCLQTQGKKAESTDCEAGIIKSGEEALAIHSDRKLSYRNGSTRGLSVDKLFFWDLLAQTSPLQSDHLSQAYAKQIGATAPWALLPYWKTPSWQAILDGSCEAKALTEILPHLPGRGSLLLRR